MGRSFSFNRALSETQYFSFDRETKESQRKTFAERLWDTFKSKEKVAEVNESYNTDLVMQHTSNEEVDSILLGRFHVIKNHLKMSLLVSVLLFLTLILPYFLDWYREPSTVPGSDLYFGLNRVWVPI